MEVVKLLDRRPIGDKGNITRYAIFKCPYCGSEVERPLSNGKRNQSCGCVHMQLVGKGNTTHGDSRKNAKYHKLFKVWLEMRYRCNNKDIPYYGDKGISVCKEWDNYTAFKKWSLDNGYTTEYSLQIDRKDSSKDYCPTNCRWVTPKVNQRNRDLVILNEAKALEIRKSLKQGANIESLAEEYGVHKDTIRDIKNEKTWKACLLDEEKGE